MEHFEHMKRQKAYLSKKDADRCYRSIGVFCPLGIPFCIDLWYTMGTTRGLLAVTTSNQQVAGSNPAGVALKIVL